MSNAINEGTLMWEPSKEFKETSILKNYMQWLKNEKELSFDTYDQLWEWSVAEIEDFWKSLWDYFNIKASTQPNEILSERKMPGAKWFSGATLNYTEQIFQQMRVDKPAIIYQSELIPLREMSWQELYTSVATFAKGLRALGVKRGDRVAAYMPNIPETVVAFLACASIGAIWSSSSPEFGSETVVQRIKQIEPTVFIAVDGYRFAGKDFNRLTNVKEIQASIPSIKHTIILPYLKQTPDTNKLENIYIWDNFVKEHKTDKLTYEQVPFEHPLWVLYSSGTTGIPKAIVQGHGNIILEHYKSLAFHFNLKKDDRLFWYTTTGWMMWNLLVGGLLAGATIVLYDGSPTHPSPEVLWDFAEKTKLNIFGTSPPFLMASKQYGITPKESYDLEHVTTIGSTGAPLTPELFQWVYEDVKEDVWLGSVSGGTDICSAFVLSSPLHPVRAGEIQCVALGAKIVAYDAKGKQVVDEVGELVIEEPMPSMPIYFWGDESGERYFESYFEDFPGVWTHGDWIKINANGSCQIYGRSDSTINRGGIRMGTSEIYSVVENLPEIKDSLVVDISELNENISMPLFVVLNEGTALDESLISHIKDTIKQNCSPRHVPDKVYEITDIPRTLNGKKLEVPVKRILMGNPVEKAANLGSMDNPESLDYFISLAKKLRG